MFHVSCSKLMGRPLVLRANGLIFSDFFVPGVPMAPPPCCDDDGDDDDVVVVVILLLVNPLIVVDGDDDDDGFLRVRSMRG